MISERKRWPGKIKYDLWEKIIWPIKTKNKSDLEENNPKSNIKFFYSELLCEQKKENIRRNYECRIDFKGIKKYRTTKLKLKKSGN